MEAVCPLRPVPISLVPCPSPCYKVVVHHARFPLLQLGWFSTARGPGSRALLRSAREAIEAGQLNARIAFVFCNRERGESPETDEFFRQVESYGIPLVTYSFAAFKEAQNGKGMGFNGTAFAPWREAYDREVLNRLSGYHPNLAVLAGYMLVMTPDLVRRFPNINLHPALPNGPVGTWQQVIWELIEKRADESGIFMHLATPVLDRGPVVAYCRYSLRGAKFDALWRELGDRTADEVKSGEGEESALFQAIRAEGMRRELPFILETLKACSSITELRVTNDQLVDGNGVALTMLDLTEQVEASVTQVSSNSPSEV